MMTPDQISDLDTRRRRVRYRAWHRGMLEMDMILGPFADAELRGFDNDKLNRFEQLMDETDADLLSWIMGRAQPGPEIDAELIAELTRFQLQRSAKK